MPHFIRTHTAILPAALLAACAGTSSGENDMAGIYGCVTGGEPPYYELTVTQPDRDTLQLRDDDLTDGKTRVLKKTGDSYKTEHLSPRDELIWRTTQKAGEFEILGTTEAVDEHGNIIGTERNQVVSTCSKAIKAENDRSPD